MGQRVRHLWILVLACSPAVAGSPRRAFVSHKLAPEGTGEKVASEDSVAAAAARAVASFGVVTSTFRTVAHNRAVGGVPDSYHLLARAIDIVRRPGVTHAQVAAALTASGYALVESLDEGTHSHFAFAPRLPQTAQIAKQSVDALKPRVMSDEHGVLLVDLAPHRNFPALPAGRH